MALFKVRIRSYKPLQLTLAGGSQMILPPMASTLDSSKVAPWVTGHAYVYGDIVRNGKHYYWCITPAGGNAGANAPTQTDGDANDGKLIWRYVRWHRDVISITVVSSDGYVSIARGCPAVTLNGLVLYAYGILNEGYGADLQPYAGAYYAIPDQANRVIAISEG